MLSGIVTVVRFVHWTNTLPPIFSFPSGNVKLERLEQKENEKSPILFAVWGIFMLLRLVHL